MRWRLVFGAVMALGCGTTATPANTAVDAAPADTAQPDVAVDDVAPDVPEEPVTPGEGPLGAECASDGDCQSTLCVTSPGLRPGCARACTTDSECSAPGATMGCVADHSPRGVRLVCNDAPGASVDTGGPCGDDTQCASQLCLDGLCHNPCARDEDCVAGWTCSPTPVAGRTLRVCTTAPVTEVTVQDIPLFEGTARVDDGMTDYAFVAPPDTVSITWITQDLEGRDLFASVARVISPDNEDLVNIRTWSSLREQPIRTLLSRYQINGATRPSRDDDAATPGIYRSAHGLYNDRTGGTVATRRMRAMVRLKRAPGGAVARGWSLRLAVYFVGLPGGPTAATAAANRRYQSAITQMQTVYRTAGIEVVVDSLHDITGADAARFTVIDSRDEMQALFARSEGLTGDVLPLFFVQGVSMSAGLDGAIGVAGAINGPPGIYGTVASGVVAGWSTTLSRTDLLGQVISHECGHYLGLWHPLERLAPCTTTGQSECSILGGVDPITDTPTTGAVTSNLMYWSTMGSNVAISPGQSRVMRMHALVH